MPALSATARRSRAYRQRHRDGTVIVSVEVTVAEQKALVDANLINPDVSLDRAAIAGGIMVLLEYLADGEIVATTD